MPILAGISLVADPAAADAATITVQPYDLATDADLTQFKYLVNEDNAHDPADPDPMQRPSIAPTESNSPVVAVGDEAHPSVDLADGKYLVSVESGGHKMWGKHIQLPQDAGEVRIGMRATPNPLGKIRVFVFGDTNWTNSAPDEGETGLGGFHVTIEDQIRDQVTVDYFNDPLCGGDCVTEPDGFLEINNLAPGTYYIRVTPPDGSDYIQTSTFEGGFEVRAGVEEGSDGSGAPGEGLWEPLDRRTGFFFGFVQPKDFDSPGTGTISGVARNWVGWPPFDNLLMGDPVADPYIALSDTSNDAQVYTARGDGDGNFTIQNVPAGTYTLAIWDEQLTHIIRFLNVIVGPGENVDLGDVGVSRWFGWVSGDVYTDDDGDGIEEPTDGNGVRDPGEPGIGNTDLDMRWRDGSIKEATFTDPTGHYEFPTAEGGSLGKFYIGEVGFGRFSTTGPSLHDEYDPSQVAPVPQELGGGLLTNQKSVEGHRSEVDWGKRPYADGEVGQITGIVFHATTRNELDPRLAAAENYEPGIPDVTVRLEGLGPDGDPNTPDDPILNEYAGTDHYSAPTDCAVTDSAGNPLVFPDVNPLIGPNCLEVPTTGAETKDGAFDGGYAFADMCPLNPDGSSTFPCAEEDLVPLEAGDYITHVLMPENASGDPMYQIVREEDVNVDNGEDFVPAIPPPECVGDPHFVDPALVVERSPYGGQTRPLCDKRLVRLQDQQNPGSDFFLFPRNGMETGGRLIGLVSDDIYFERDPQSIWYGEARPLADIPIGIRDYNDRLITTTKTDTNGAYEVMLPSTDTINCPTPQGICPGMYRVVVNDPGDKSAPNPNYSPDHLTATLAWEVWPGQTTQLDTPLDPISGTGCELPLNMPELLEVSRPYMGANATGNARRIVIRGDWFGTPAGQVTLARSGQPTATLTTGNGGIVSWTDRRIVINVPTTGAGFPAGPKQLEITTAAGNTTSNGLTLHVFGSGYGRPIVNVQAPTANPHAIQDAIDAAAPGSILVLQPGVYQENVILHKRLTLQGLGPGGIVGSPEIGGRDPDDPRFNIQGTSIDGRFIADNEAYWSAKLASLSFDGNQAVPIGGDITVVASNGEFLAGFNAPRIDGIGLATGHGAGAGGVQVNAFGRNLEITNNVLESNGGGTAGAIGLGSPYVGDNQNDNVKISQNRVMGNGGLVRAGGIGIYNGANRYSIDNNIICSNFANEYGGGISHWGLSPNGTITRNQVYYNASVDSGGGIALAQELPQPAPGPTDPPGPGTGSVNVTRNLLQMNYSGDDGGGIFVLDAHTTRVGIVNNMIVDNGAAEIGGAITLDDSTNVTIVNDTIANNVSTASGEGSDGTPHSAGLAAEANSDSFQNSLTGPNQPDFSRPRALFNNIFWENEAFTIDGTTVPPSLVSQGFIDFEVFGTTVPRTFTPRYSLLTAPHGPPNQGNIVGQDPLFVNPFTLELVVSGSRLDPQTRAVTIVGQDPPVGLQGDYHLQGTSPAIDEGAPFSNFPFPPVATSPSPSSILAPSDDYDGQARPQGSGLTPFDIGADEVPAP